MKYRLTALVFFLSVIFVSCSLSEDLTPPPGYQSLSSTQSIASLTPPEKVTSTPAPSIITPEVSKTTPAAGTPSQEASGTADDLHGSIYVNLVNGSGSAISAGQQVTLEGFDKDKSGNYQKVLEVTAPVDLNGSYHFTDLEWPQERAFIVITSFGEVEYQSDPVMASDNTSDTTLPITIYETTKDLNVISASQVHLIFNFPSPDVLQVTELFIVTNPGKKVVVVSSDGTTIPFIHPPENAGDVQYQLSQGSAQLLNAVGGFAMVPGADKQYGFIASYSMPYKRNLKFAQPFSMPVASLTVFIPQGMRLTAEQVTDAGPQDIQGQSYQMYQANNMASGSSLSMTLSGKPGASTGSAPDKQTWVLIGIGVVGVLLIGIGIYLYLRDRARLKIDDEISEEELEEDAIEEDRDSLMDALIALDDQYKAGGIPKVAYELRRSELKKRLKAVLKFQDMS